MRASISLVTSCTTGNEPNTAPKATAKNTPPNSALKAWESRGVSPRTMPRAMPKMGVIRGETSMAPMTTAALLATRPRLAMSEAAEIRA